MRSSSPVQADQPFDGFADEDDVFQVEVQPEVGCPGKVKLYVHCNGQTWIRVCKIAAERIHVEPFRERRFTAP